MSTALSWALLEERYGLTLMTPSAVGTTLSALFERVVVIRSTLYAVGGVVGNGLVQAEVSDMARDHIVTGNENAHSLRAMVCYRSYSYGAGEFSEVMSIGPLRFEC